MDMHRSTQRVIDVLELLCDAPDGMTLTELSSKLEIPKGSLYPILFTLRSNKMLSMNDSTAKYQIGIKNYIIGSSYSARVDTDSQIRQIVKRLADQTRETCHFAVLEGNCTVYLVKEDSCEQIRMVSSVGKRVYAHSTAVGKALLSGLSREQLDALYPGNLPALTQHTITDKEALLLQLDSIRRGGFACESEESSPGVTCRALPIYKNAQVIAALSVSVPVFRADNKKIELVMNALLHCRDNAQSILSHADIAF